MDPILSAEEMADPAVDHLSIMTYISRFKHVKPKKSDSEKLEIKASLDNILTGIQVRTMLYK